MIKKQRSRPSDDEDEEIPPMPVSFDSGSAWDFRQSAVVSESRDQPAKKNKQSKGDDPTEQEPSASSSSSATRTCPEGHALRLFRTPHDEFFCELCGDDQYLPKGAMLFGCRECDWDACATHTHEDVQKREVLREKQMNEPKTKGREIASKEGDWKMLRGADKYKNEYMYLRHSGSKVVLELCSHSSGICTFRAGVGEQPRSCSEAGEIAPFQLTLSSVVKRLDGGEGKGIAKKIELGNWKVISLDDGAAVVLHDMQFLKTSRHKEGTAPESLLTSHGLEIHLTGSGELVWIAPETQDDLALIVCAHQLPQTSTRDAAVKWLGVEGGVDDGNYSNTEEEEEDDDEDEEEEDEAK